jgi:hypothetical protein
MYNPATATLEGFRLAGDLYQPLTPNRQGRLWSEQLGLELGLWQGVKLAIETAWVRLYDSKGRLIPTFAEAEGQRADAERRRADAAEAEVARLRARLQGD